MDGESNIFSETTKSKPSPRSGFGVGFWSLLALSLCFFNLFLDQI